jgi:hypothetical protein
VAVSVRVTDVQITIAREALTDLSEIMLVAYEIDRQIEAIAHPLLFACGAVRRGANDAAQIPEDPDDRYL